MIAHMKTMTDGRLIVLTNDGQIREQATPPAGAFQHLPQSRQPKFVWQTIPRPTDEPVSEIECGVQGTLFALADGVVYERVRDTNVFHRVEYRWQPVNTEEPHG